MTPETFAIIRALVGESITREDLAFVDCFVHEWCGLFLPIGGNCGYAVTPEHIHPSYMFVVPYDSESTVYVEGKRIATRPRTLICLSPGIPHHEVQDYLPPKYCAVCIEKRRFETIYSLYGAPVALFCGDVVETHDSNLDLLMKAFILESQNAHASRNLLLENLSQLLTHEIIRTLPGMFAPGQRLPQGDKVEAALRFMNANYEKEISLSDIAKSASLSKSHFTKLFTQTMAIPPMTYLQQLRLENAKKMLANAQLDITEVSVRCGFNSLSYFSKCFKARYNETPGAFMQRGK